MFIVIATLTALGLWAIFASIADMARDGYRRRPTRNLATARQDAHADRDRDHP